MTKPSQSASYLASLLKKSKAEIFELLPPQIPDSFDSILVYGQLAALLGIETNDNAALQLAVSLHSGLPT